MLHDASYSIESVSDARPPSLSDLTQQTLFANHVVPLFFSRFEIEISSINCINYNHGLEAEINTESRSAQVVAFSSLLPVVSPRPTRPSRGLYIGSTLDRP